MDRKAGYKRWKGKAPAPDIWDQLIAMYEAAVEDSFYRKIVFGMGILRGTVENLITVPTMPFAVRGLKAFAIVTEEGKETLKTKSMDT